MVKWEVDPRPSRSWVLPVHQRWSFVYVMLVHLEYLYQSQKASQAISGVNKRSLSIYL